MSGNALGKFVDCGRGWCVVSCCMAAPILCCSADIQSESISAESACRMWDLFNEYTCKFYPLEGSAMTTHLVGEMTSKQNLRSPSFTGRTVQMRKSSSMTENESSLLRFLECESKSLQRTAQQSITINHNNNNNTKEYTVRVQNVNEMKSTS